MLQQEDKNKNDEPVRKLKKKTNSVLVHSLPNSTCDPFLGNANKNDLYPPLPETAENIGMKIKKQFQGKKNLRIFRQVSNFINT